MSNDKLSTIFDVPAVQLTPVVVPYGGDERIATDADFARANLKGLIETARRALETAVNLAADSENPRAYEALTALINTAADLNTRLIDIHQREKKISIQSKQGEEGSVTKNITNNVIFTGTTNDLNDIINRRLTQ